MHVGHFNETNGKLQQSKREDELSLSNVDRALTQ